MLATVQNGGRSADAVKNKDPRFMNRANQRMLAKIVALITTVSSSTGTLAVFPAARVMLSNKIRSIMPKHRQDITLMRVVGIQTSIVLQYYNQGARSRDFVLQL